MFDGFDESFFNPIILLKGLLLMMVLCEVLLIGDGLLLSQTGKVPVVLY